MSDPANRYVTAARSPGSPATLADVLERVLDKGVVIAGDISISLLDIELITIRLRLLIASLDKAEEMGIDWWRSDPYLSSQAGALQQENERLRDRLEELESRLEQVAGDGQAEAQLPKQASGERQDE